MAADVGYSRTSEDDLSVHGDGWIAVCDWEVRQGHSSPHVSHMKFNLAVSLAGVDGCDEAIDLAAGIHDELA